jgi:hypothetical protein
MGTPMVFGERRRGNGGGKNYHCTECTHVDHCVFLRSFVGEVRPRTRALFLHALWRCGIWGFGSIGRWCRRYFSVRDLRTRWCFTCTALTRHEAGLTERESWLPDISAMRTSGYIAPNWSGVGMHRRFDDCRAPRHSPSTAIGIIYSKRSCRRAWPVTQVQAHVATRVVDHTRRDLDDMVVAALPGRRQLG